MGMVVVGVGGWVDGCTQMPHLHTQGCYTCFAKSMVQICCVFCACALMTGDGKIVHTGGHRLPITLTQ